MFYLATCRGHARHLSDRKWLYFCSVATPTTRTCVLLIIFTKKASTHLSKAKTLQNMFILGLSCFLELNCSNILFSFYILSFCFFEFIFIFLVQISVFFRPYIFWYSLHFFRFSFLSFSLKKGWSSLDTYFVFSGKKSQYLLENNVMKRKTTVHHFFDSC